MRLKRRFWRRNTADLNCKEVGQVLQAFLDGELDDADAPLVAAHLDDCRMCGLESASYERIKAALAQPMPEGADPEAIDLLVAGPAVEAHFEEGANVHFVAVSGRDELSVRVWERGAGVTNACGTGATVAADVFHRWGLVGEKVVVHMPGGNALVDLGTPLTLTGPATHVADLLVPDA